MPAPSVPPTCFAPVQGGRLAYQIFGTGPATLVSVPPTAQNIEVCWEYPAIRAMLERFGSFCRFLHVDKRGTGCSDPSGRIADLDERVDDLRAVMDHAGIPSAHLLGNSEGGPMALLFAATYPDRVEGVFLHGSGASLHPPGLTEEDREQLREQHRRYAAVWGTPRSPVAAGFAPSLVAQDPDFAMWHQRYERLAASQRALLELLELGLTMDVRGILPEVRAPVVLFHRTDDRVFPVERAREAAALLPDAELVEQPGADHFAYAGDVDGWMQVLERRITGTVRPRPPSHPPARPQVVIRTLGGFGVDHDGSPVPTGAWGSRRSRQLCKRLVAARGWPVTRDELFELLWPGETDRARLGPRLSVQLSMVRRVLHGGVVADRSCVRLDLDEVSIDLEQLLRAGSDAEVVGSYTGAFLPEDPDEPWAHPVRAEVTTRFLDAAHRVAAEALDDGDAPRAVTLLTQVLATDPYDDEAHRGLVGALLDVGAESEARHAHARWAAATRELGLDPPPPLGPPSTSTPAG